MWIMDRRIGFALLWGALASLAWGCAEEAPANFPQIASTGSQTAAHAGSAAPAKNEKAVAVVTSQKGKVEVRRGGTTQWAPLSVGDRLVADDSLRTLRDSRVELSVNEVKVRVHEQSHLGVKSITDTALRAKVTGRMESEVPLGKGRVEIEAEGSDAVVTTTGGHFAVMSDGHGVVSVATVTGRVNLEAAGKSVDVTPGKMSGVVAGQAPRAPEAAMREVLLSVSWPQDRVTNRRSIPIAGVVEVGSRVLVQGEPIKVGPDGKFNTEIELEQGQQLVAIVAEDAMGRRRQKSANFERDNVPPSMRVKEPLWR